MVALAPRQRRTGGRSARVVEAVLAATLDEFAANGWDGLHIDAVAQRAGVNKTTVYRRWPTKVELLRAALLERKELLPEPPDTGDVRRDLVFVLTTRLEQLTSPIGRGVARAILLGGSSPSLQSIRESVRDKRPAIPDVLIDRAIARGELPAHLDRALFRDLLMSPLQARLFLRNEDVTEAFIANVVDVVVSGVTARASRSGSPSGSAPAPRAAPSSRSKSGTR